MWRNFLFYFLSLLRGGAEEREKELKEGQEGGFTSDQSLGSAVTQLTNQVVEATGKTGLTASLLLGVWMETLEGALRWGGDKDA